MLELSVESAVDRQLHASLACPAVADSLPSVIADLSRMDAGVDLFTAIMGKNPSPARLRAAPLTPEMLRCIDAHMVTDPDLKETIIGAVLPNVRKAIAEMRATPVRTAPELRPMDATKLLSERATLINEALRASQGQTVADTRIHVQDAFDFMRRALQTLCQRQYLCRPQTGRRTQYGACRDKINLLRLYQATWSRLGTSLISYPGAHATCTCSTEPKRTTFYESQAFTQRATHSGCSPPHSEPATPPWRSVITSARYHALRAPTPMNLDKANAQLPSNLAMQRTMHPGSNKLSIFGNTAL